jgi:formylglycine-generating enzyme required for sulfatase activity
LSPGQAQRVTTQLKRAEVGTPGQPGTTRVDPRTGITWVWMPAGTFEQEQYEACARDGACSSELRSQDTPENTCNWKNARASHPMNCVNWEEAVAFCRWAGGRLPTATEWEYAAKSGQAVIFPWNRNARDGRGIRGVRPDGRLANFCDKNCPAALSEANRAKWIENGWFSIQVDDGFAGTAPVGSYPAGASAWGLLDMAGNVWEWTSSNYDAERKEVRGGGWGGTPELLRASLRNGGQPEGRNVNNGFRCAQ